MTRKAETRLHRIGVLRLPAVWLLASLPLSAALAQGKPPEMSPRPPGPKAPEVAPAPMEGVTGDWHASKLIGTTMTNVLGESVGRVEDVVIDGDGKVVAVLVGVGGFLGMGETSVAIGMRHLVVSRVDADRLEVRTSLSRRAIEQAAQLDPADDQPLPP